jgi:hypothetical protein
VPSIGAVFDELDQLNMLFGYGDLVEGLTRTGDQTQDVNASWLRRLRDSWIVLILVKILGLVLTVVAVSLGAPFWFDLLQRVSNIRAAGKPPEQAASEKKAVSEEKAAPRGQAASP